MVVCRASVERHRDCRLPPTRVRTSTALARARPINLTHRGTYHPEGDGEGPPAALRACAGIRLCPQKGELGAKVILPRPKASMQPQRPGMSSSSSWPSIEGMAGSTRRWSPVGSRPVGYTRLGIPPETPSVDEDSQRTPPADDP